MKRISQRHLVAWALIFTLGFVVGALSFYLLQEFMDGDVSPSPTQIEHRGEIEHQGGRQ